LPQPHPPQDESGHLGRLAAGGAAAGILATSVAALLSPAGPEGDLRVLLVGATGGLLLVAYLLAIRAGRARPPTLAVLLIVTILPRILVVAGPLRIDDDIWRYLWDGLTLSAGVSPYAFAPQAVLEFEPEWDRILIDDNARFSNLETLAALGQEPENREILEQINFSFFPTIYPPASQWTFAALAVVSPGQERAVRAAMAALDVVTAFLLYALLGALGRPQWWALSYAWHPLPLLEFGSAGHQDVLGIFALAAALLALSRARSPVRLGRSAQGLAGLLLALSIGAKLFPVAIAWIARRRLGALGVSALVVTTVLLGAPLLLQGDIDPAGLQAYLRQWEFFSGPFAIVGALTKTYSRTIVAAILLAALFAIGRRVRSATETVAASTRWVEICIILSPVVDPWYVPWALALTSLRGSLAWPLFALAIPLAYLPAPPEGHAWALRALVWVPFLVAWGAELRPHNAQD